MKTAILLLFLPLLSSLPLVAQELPLAVYTLNHSGKLSNDQEAALRSKIIGMVSNTGYASADNGAPVGVAAELVQYEPRTVNAGTRNLVTIEAELVLTVQQRDGKAVFGSKRKKITVSGRDLAQAKSQIVAAFPSNDAILQAFLQETKPKIEDYYSKNCALLLADAERKATTDQFADALSILTNIPANAGCRADADQQLEKVYNQYRDQICRRQMLAVQSATAAKDYSAAAAALRLIDPRSSCYAEAGKLAEQLRSQADADFNTTLDALVEYWKSESALDQRRYDIVRSFLKDIF